MRDLTANLQYFFLRGQKIQTPDLGRFYKRNGYKGKIQSDDLCAWIEINEEITAAARIRPLNDETTIRQLRGLWVHKSHRGQTLGTLLLRSINQHATDNKYDLYLLAYPHLTLFYRMNNYQPLGQQETPESLLTKQLHYEAKGTPTIAMRLIMEVH